MQPLVTQPNPSADTEEYVIIGRFGRPYGVQGWIKLLVFTDPPENIFDYPDWYIKQDTTWNRLKVSECKSHGVLILAKLDGYDAPESVKRFTNVEIAIPRGELPVLSEDEVYLHDLPGFEAKNLAGETLGTVKKIFDSGAHDIINVEGTASYLIPFVRDTFVKNIDKSARIITVDWESDDTA